MKKYFWATGLLSAVLLCGCAHCSNVRDMTAAAAQNIQIDGILNEKCWTAAPEYELATAVNGWNSRHPELRNTYGRKVVSPAKVKILFDKKYLYFGAVMTDDDILTVSTKDQDLHCNRGDVFEIFLKPEKANYYWEVHITPGGHCAVMFYPSRGYHFLAPIVLPEDRPLKNIKFKSVLNGTLNKNTDIDKTWVLEAALPLSEIAAKGIPLDPQNQWRILIGRYNYSCHQKVCELSSFPQLDRFDFHSHEEYGFLRLKK